MEPKYSILLCNQQLSDYKAKIAGWLRNGIKVFWFGKADNVTALNREFEPFSSALFLQCFVVRTAKQAVIIDGTGCEPIVAVLEKEVPDFNAGQYLVEHCKADEHIIVEASAGTGKTTVMIDRILFLLHTIENLDPSDIYMITFTNDATNQMNDRLQKMLLKKYQLTGNHRYLIWLEKQSEMHISTIHSFAYDFLKEYGVEAGFSKNLKLHSMNFERRELIKDEMDELVSPERNVRSQIGMSFYEGNATIDKFWEKFAQRGYSKEEILDMDWGACSDDVSEKFQKITLSVLERLDDDYLALKQKNNAIALTDVQRDLVDILESADASLSDLQIKYLFVDEFQDSDNSQIKILAWIVRNLGTRLFVVGDIKQSIYRFRGANDTAFSTLEGYLGKIGARKPRIYSLVNNYRTSQNVLETMNQYFTAWATAKLLDYRQSIRPINKEPGYIRMAPSAGSYNLGEQFSFVAVRALEDRNERLAETAREPKESDRVVVLCRSNGQLKRIGKICSENHIPAIVKKDGSFYTSAAVRDFYAMVSSFVFPDEPKYLFNYLIGPYSGLNEPIDVSRMEAANGDRVALHQYLDTFLEKTGWQNYYKEFRLRPVMAVIRNMLDSEDIVDRYLAKVKRSQAEKGWSEPAGSINALALAKQYKANLDKLMELLQRNGKGEYSSLYDIYEYLRIFIATNRDEQEAEVEDKDNIDCLYCMTVHKAKGMEFDTVIIPYTDLPFYYDTDTELLISNDNTRVGWKHCSKNTGQNLSNENYARLRKEEELSATQEDTRILYVAMTRAIHSLICLVAPDKKKNTWAHLIRKVGVSNE